MNSLAFGYIFLILASFAVIVSIIDQLINLYRRHKIRAPKYRILEITYQTDRNINGKVMEVHNYYVICQDGTWYLGFRIRGKIYVAQYHNMKYADKFFSKDEAKERVNDMLANPDNYIIDE